MKKLDSIISWDLIWSILIHLLMAFCVYFMILSIIQVTPYRQKPYNTRSTILAIVFIIAYLAILSLFIIMAIIYSTTFNSNYLMPKSMYKIQSNTIGGKVYYLVWLFRRLVYCYILIGLNNQRPSALIKLAIFIQILYLRYIIPVNIFKNWCNKILEIG